VCSPCLQGRALNPPRRKSREHVPKSGRGGRRGSDRHCLSYYGAEAADAATLALTSAHMAGDLGPPMSMSTSPFQLAS
jgi:hypothetical protein